MELTMYAKHSVLRQEDNFHKNNTQNSITFVAGLVDVFEIIL